MLNFKKYKTDTSGNVAMMFSGTVVLLLTGLGVAVDYSNMSRAQSMLQSQVDAGVLAAASVEIEQPNNGINDGSNTEEIQARETAAKDVIEANGFSLTGIDPVLILKEDSVVLKAELDYKPLFGGILGINTIRLSADAESGIAGFDGAYIALVLDSTHSMSVNGKMDALKAGAESLVDIIEESGSDSKIALVPFSRYVRINESLKTASWFEMPTEFDTDVTWQQAVRTGGTCTEETRTNTFDGVEQEYQGEACTGQTTTYEERMETVESRWEGCVGTRVPPYSERDDAYSHKVPGLLRKVPGEHFGSSGNVYANCPSEILPLTTNYDELRSEINRMWTTDNTYLPAGLIWGQRILSPGEPFDSMLDEEGPEKRKVMILMTDGNNTTEIKQDAASEANWQAPPYIANVGSNEIATEANAATVRMCQNAKDEGIEIFTIAFQVTDPATKSLLRNCASSAENSLVANSNIALVRRFKKVAESLRGEIRLMR